MRRLHLVFWFVCAICATNRVYGHGFAGARFFPATLSTDDPFVADELSLPTVSTIRTPDDGGTRETDISVEIAKRITPQFGIAIGETEWLCSRKSAVAAWRHANSPFDATVLAEFRHFSKICTWLQTARWCRASNGRGLRKIRRSLSRPTGPRIDSTGRGRPGRRKLPPVA